MDRIEIQRKLYDARNAYLKAKSAMEFHQREIAYLKQRERDLSVPSDWLFQELFGDSVVVSETN